MKKTQRKDAFQNIRKRIVSFFSILLVIALGVGIYLACRNASVAMRDKGNDFCREVRYCDLEIRSTHGITEDDIKAVKETEGVTDAEGFYKVDLVAAGEKDRTVVHVISETKRINIGKILNGRLPSEKKECVAEQELLDALGLSVGDTLKLSAKSGARSSYLFEETFTITGSFLHPDNYHVGEVVTYNVMLPYEAFDKEEAGVPFTAVLIRTDTDAMDTFSQEYAERVASIEEALTALGEERSKIRDEEILKEADEKLAEKKEELDEGRESLDTNREELSKKEEELTDAKTELDSAAEKLASGKVDLNSSEEELKEAKEQIDSAGKDLDSAYQQLEEARTQLDSSYSKLADSENELDSAGDELEAAEQTLSAKRGELASAWEELDAARRQLDEGERQFDDTFYAQLNESWIPEFLGPMPARRSFRDLSEDYTLSYDESILNLMRDTDLSEETILVFLESHKEEPQYIEANAAHEQFRQNEAAYRTNLATYEENKALLEEEEKKVESSLEQYNSNVATYNASVSEYEKKKGEYESNLAQYNKNRKQYEESLTQYEEGMASLEEGRKKVEEEEQNLSEKEQEYKDGEEDLSEGETTLAEKEQEYEEGLVDYEEAVRDRNSYEGGHWIYLDRYLNLSWYELSETKRTFSSIGNSFALLFVLLAVLVCYATIGKLIDDQRVLVGTTKALGFYRREILAKYMLFGTLAAVLGTAAGLALSYFVLENMILTTAQKSYTFGAFPMRFTVIPAALAVIIAVAVASIATYFGCRRLLSQSAKMLLGGEVPSTRRKEAKKAKREKPLYSGLILRNMRSDWKRVLITIVSIAGCCMLLIIGFSLRFSFDGVIERQFEDILTYDVLCDFLPEESESVEEDLQKVLDEAGIQSSLIYQFNTVLRIGTDKEGTQIVSGDPDELSAFYRLTDLKGKTELKIPETGVMIYKRLAEVYDLSVGDPLLILDEEGVYHDTVVSGIYNNYAGRCVFMSESTAKRLFEGTYAGNSFIVRKNGASLEALFNNAESVDGFLRFRYSNEERAKYQAVADALNTVILVMILMAAIMAAVVLLNLVRIQINQKKRELTIMRINGFTTGETVAYVLRENIVTTICGILLGLVIGNLAAYYNLRSIERVELQMIREISIKACLLSAGITLLFAVIVNFLALWKLRHLKLSDVQ